MDPTPGYPPLREREILAAMERAFDEGREADRQALHTELCRLIMERTLPGPPNEPAPAGMRFRNTPWR